MRFNYFLAAAAAVCSTAFAADNKPMNLDGMHGDDELGTIYAPKEGEIIHAGTDYTIKWKKPDLDGTGKVEISVMSDNGTFHEQHEAIINRKFPDLCTQTTFSSHDANPSLANKKAKDQREVWSVPKDFRSGDNYYIRIVAIDDTQTYVDSGTFSVRPGNGTASASSSARGSASTLMPTATPSRSASGSSSTPSPTSTSIAGASVPTGFAPAPLAMLGVAAVGIMAF